MIDPKSIFETIQMIEKEKLDIRTITMGISLLDCVSSTQAETREKVYQKIVTSAKDLVETARQIEIAYGVPIINTRISVTPIALLVQNGTVADAVEMAKTLDKAAETVGVNFIGGFSALVQKGFTVGDKNLIAAIPEALDVTERVCSSVNVGDTRSGINMDAVKWMGEIIQQTAERTADRDSIGCAKLVVFANAVEDNPFMAGAFHGVGEAERVIHVGISGPGVIKSALEKVQGEPIDEVAQTIKKMAFKITRAGQLVANEASKRLGVPFGIIDLSLAPTPAVGDSVARILEEIGVEAAGTHGTTMALAMLNDAVKKGGIMASSHVGGLSGAFIPVSEDEGMIVAVRSGAMNIEKLEAMTCVCSVGLDMIAVPGDTPATTLSAMIADEAAIGVINHKTTAVRVIPVWGKQVGDEVHFGGLLGSAPVMKVNSFGSDRLILRGGRMPAPVHSFKN